MRYSLLLLAAAGALSCGPNTQEPPPPPPPPPPPAAVVSLTATPETVEFSQASTLGLHVENCLGGRIFGGRFGFVGADQPVSTELSTGPLTEPVTDYNFGCTDLRDKAVSVLARVSVRLVQPSMGLTPSAQSPPPIAWLNSTISIQPSTQYVLQCMIRLRPAIDIGEPGTVFRTLTGDPCGSSGSFQVSWGSTMPQTWTEAAGATVWIVGTGIGMSGSTPKSDSLPYRLAAEQPILDSITPRLVPFFGNATLHFWIHGHACVSANTSAGVQSPDYTGFWGCTVGFRLERGISNPGQFVSPDELVVGYVSFGAFPPGSQIQGCVYTQPSGGLGGGGSCSFVTVADPNTSPSASGPASSLVSSQGIDAVISRLRRAGVQYQVSPDRKFVLGPAVLP